MVDRRFRCPRACSGLRADPLTSAVPIAGGRAAHCPARCVTKVPGDDRRREAGGRVPPWTRVAGGDPPTRRAPWRPSCSARRGPFAGFKVQLGSLATVDEKRTAGQAVNAAVAGVTAALDGRRRALAGAERAGSWRPRASTSPSCSPGRGAATPTSSPRHGSGSRTCSSGSASRSPRAPRWRATGTTSRP